MTSARDNLRTVAMRLDDLGLQDVVIIGGATIGMLITGAAAPEPPATLDVDAVTAIDSRKAFNELEGRLRASGYHQPERGPICRWIIDGVTVDLMPLEESILGFSNRWYRDLLDHAQTYRLDWRHDSARQRAIPGQELGRPAHARGSQHCPRRRAGRP